MEKLYESFCTKFQKPTPGRHIVSFGRVGQLAPPCARIPLSSSLPKSSTRYSSASSASSARLIPLLWPLRRLRPWSQRGPDTVCGPGPAVALDSSVALAHPWPWVPRGPARSVALGRGSHRATHGNPRSVALGDPRPRATDHDVRQGRPSDRATLAPGPQTSQGP